MSRNDCKNPKINNCSDETKSWEKVRNQTTSTDLYNIKACNFIKDWYLQLQWMCTFAYKQISFKYKSIIVNVHWLFLSLFWTTFLVFQMCWKSPSLCYVNSTKCRWYVNIFTYFVYFVEKNLILYHQNIVYVCYLCQY